MLKNKDCDKPSNYTRVLCLIGILLSSYALYVEYKTSVNHRREDEGVEIEEFQALCDIEAIGASCSSVFSLPEGRLLSYFSIVPNEHFLDVPNAALGFFYYTAVLLIEQFFYRKYGYGCIDFVSMPQITVAFNSAAMSSSIFLAIKLIQLKELCVLCWTTHLINSLLLVHYTRRMRSLQRNVVKEKEKSK
mmetsp:Transcript_26312/g.32434  ORF Transcript_26312/g.32434 Transcript_26312/m.32434 type:complete len:190 (+) Transcript_26312:32-601(+)